MRRIRALTVLPILMTLTQTLVQAQHNNNTSSQPNNLFLMEATIECGSGHKYYTSSGVLTDQQQEWLRALLSYTNNGEVNRPQYTFEEYIENGLPAPKMNKILANQDFRRWAGIDLARAIKSHLAQRSKLLRQPPSFFKPSHMYDTPVFKSYSASRDNVIQLLINKFHVIQEDNEVNCD